jgi:hypothetical protein
MLLHNNQQRGRFIMSSLSTRAAAMGRSRALCALAYTFAAGLSLAALALFTTGDASAHAKKEKAGAKAEAKVTAYRAVVADAGSPLLRVVDLETGKVLVSAELASPARLTAGEGRRMVFAAQGAAGEVRPIDTGIAFDDHGDHADITVKAPRVLAPALKGAKPSHINHGGGKVAVFFDGDGAASLIPEKAFIAGELAKVERVATGTGHHGVAKPIGRVLAISVPKEGENLPVAIALKQGDAAASQTIDCPRLHGEGQSGRFTGFGCADGVAVFEETAAGLVGRKLAYPTSLPAGRMVRNLAGASGYSMLVGDFGPDGMVVIDPGKADGFSFVPLPARRIHFALDAKAGDKLFVLVEDGRVIKINPLTGATVAERAVTGRYSMEAGVVRPRMSSVGDVVVVSNPAASEIVVLDAETLTERRRIALAGAPFDVIAVGGTGAKH